MGSDPIYFFPTPFISIYFHLFQTVKIPHMALPANPWYKPVLALCLAATLGGCGFALRGSANLPYASLFIDLPANNALGAELARNLRAGTSTRIVERRSEAQAILQANAENRSKTILSLGSSGAVREFRLKYSFAWRVIDQNGTDIAAPGNLLIERDYSFNDNQVLAKESEEALLYRDMQTDMVQQVMRHLAAASPAAGSAAGATAPSGSASAAPTVKPAAPAR